MTEDTSCTEGKHDGPFGPGEAKGPEVLALFQLVFNDVLSFINSKPEYQTQKPCTRKLLLTQARAIAAVKSCKSYVVYRDFMETS